jgi:glycerol-3-phosphate dehydrogenase
LTRASVHERQRLLREAPGLVEPLSFMLPHYRGGFPGRRVFGGLLTVYDALAGRRQHGYCPASALRYLVPGLKTEGLLGGTCFLDAVTDDARLVLRVLGESRADGGEALNGMRVTELLRTDGRVTGVLAEDTETGQQHRFRSRAVAQATGAWAEQLPHQARGEHIRPLRGSHLLLPAWRLPVAYAVSFMHAADGRLVFVFPWEGATVVGTTDLDHHEPLAQEAHISNEEVDYLLAAITQVFPGAQVRASDVLSTWAGVRPVVSARGSRKRPSAESREHALWVEPGCVTLAGGKLTTFRPLALDVLRACAQFVGRPMDRQQAAVFSPCPPLRASSALTPTQQRRLSGRYGHALPGLLAVMEIVGSECVGATQTLWAELAWAADNELVLHLDDLLLRRTRLGLLLAHGGRTELPRIRALCQPRLAWSDARWQQEEADYLALWQRCYSLPASAQQGSLP